MCIIEQAGGVRETKNDLRFVSATAEARAAESRQKWVTESSRDPLLLGGVTVLLVFAAALACLAPARRAGSVDPMEALRSE